MLRIRIRCGVVAGIRIAVSCVIRDDHSSCVGQVSCSPGSHGPTDRNRDLIDTANYQGCPGVGNIVPGARVRTTMSSRRAVYGQPSNCRRNRIYHVNRGSIIRAKIGDENRVVDGSTRRIGRTVVTLLNRKISTCRTTMCRNDDRDRLGRSGFRWFDRRINNCHGRRWGCIDRNRGFCRYDPVRDKCLWG